MQEKQGQEVLVTATRGVHYKGMNTTDAGNSLHTGGCPQRERQGNSTPTTVLVVSIVELTITVAQVLDTHGRTNDDVGSVILVFDTTSFTRVQLALLAFAVCGPLVRNSQVCLNATTPAGMGLGESPRSRTCWSAQQRWAVQQRRMLGARCLPRAEQQKKSERGERGDFGGVVSQLLRRC